MNLRNILNSLKLKRTIFLVLVFVIPHGVSQTNIIDEAPKDRLVRTIKSWVAETEGLDVNNIDVQANDRRFIVPDCDEIFNVSFAFGTKTNVQVNCKKQKLERSPPDTDKKEHENS